MWQKDRPGDYRPKIIRMARSYKLVTLGASGVSIPFGLGKSLTTATHVTSCTQKLVFNLDLTIWQLFVGRKRIACRGSPSSSWLEQLASKTFQIPREKICFRWLPPVSGFEAQICGICMKYFSTCRGIETKCSTPLAIF